MLITKIETNYKRNLYFYKTQNVKYFSYSPKIENQVINIYPNITYQSIIGFGGAITESAGYSLKSLPLDKQSQALNEYFGINGQNYNLCRLTIGSSDFSLKSYSYSNKTDLSDFSIEKDKEYIINIVKKAKQINLNLKFLASIWSPPKFMKSNNMLYLGGKLNYKYYDLFADYLSKYILAYKNEGILIDYITIQNEPNATQIWESCLYSPEEEASFAINFLYPKFKKYNITTKILIWDHNKEKLFSRAYSEMNTPLALEAISGFAFHYYTGDHFENIELTSKIFPGKILIHTEGCTGFSNFNPNDEVKNAEIYAHEILGDLNSGANGYIDWNIALDYKGGPNHKNNYCNSPLMINKEKTDYIKNLSFYYIKHFSNIIKPNAKRIGFSRYSTDIEITVFKNIDNSLAIILLNRNNFNKEYNIVLDNIVIHDNLDSHAIVSYFITY